MARLFIQNLTKQVHLIDWRDAHGNVEYTAVAPGGTEQIGPETTLDVVERIATPLHEKYAALPSAVLPALPDYAGLAWAIEE